MLHSASPGVVPVRPGIPSSGVTAMRVPANAGLRGTGSGSGSGSGSAGTISTTCCPDRLLPETLYATFTCPGCTCINGYTLALTWSGFEWCGQAVNLSCSPPIELKLWLDCVGSDFVWSRFNLGGDCSGSGIPLGGASAATLDSCSPLQITINYGSVPGGISGCAGSCTVVVTE